MEMVFGVRVTPEESCFVLDRGSDPPMERGASPKGGVLDLKNFGPLCAVTVVGHHTLHIS